MRLAERDIDSIRRYIAEDKPAAARRWVREIRRQANSLSRFPARHEVVPELVELAMEYRQILHGAYLTIYRVDRERVLVVRVVHGAQLNDSAITENRRN